MDRLKEKYTGETTVDAADTLKDAIVEAKQCGVCGFLAKDEEELQEHKQGKKHFTDKWPVIQYFLLDNTFILIY